MEYSAHNVYPLKHEPIYAHLVKKVHFFYWPKTTLGCTTTGLKTMKFGHASQLVACHLHPKEVRGDMQKRNTYAGAPFHKIQKKSSRITVSNDHHIPAVLITFRRSIQ
jgi:hypothetical protein